jgi:hypothetical protein
MVKKKKKKKKTTKEQEDREREWQITLCFRCNSGTKLRSWQKHRKSKEEEVSLAEKGSP